MTLEFRSPSGLLKAILKDKLAEHSFALMTNNDSFQYKFPRYKHPAILRVTSDGMTVAPVPEVHIPLSKDDYIVVNL